MFTAIKSTFQKIKTALRKSSSKLAITLRGLFSKPIDANLLEEIEKTLYEADLGSTCVSLLIEKIKTYHLQHPQASAEDFMMILKKGCKEILDTVSFNQMTFTHKPSVILVCGVNGSGKTTSCAKLAKLFQNNHQSVILGAADTFRAAAIEQLTIWSDRLQIPIVKGMPNGDPASVAFDTINKAISQNISIAIIDTAGRLESKSQLMQELSKISRTMKKLKQDAPHATYLVLDATIGQTALDQIRIFHEHTAINGLILTKLDGTAKGGVILSIIQKYKIPVLYVGVGEGAEDFLPFDPDAYIEGLFAL